MDPKKWFLSKPRWLRGGIIGVIVCIVLFLFNIFVYFPIINNIYGGSSPQWTLILPTITGHTFPILSHFIVPYGWLCKFTELTCVHWNAESVPGAGAIPWTLETGEQGYCVDHVLASTSPCANLSETISFLGLTILLFAAYFLIGAVIGLIIQKRK